jgi:hypothetical protein
MEKRKARLKRLSITLSGYTEEAPFGGIVLVILLS